jgi:signal transduction histidine kinase
MLRRRLTFSLTTQLLLLLVVATVIPLGLMLDRIRNDALDAEQRAATRAGWVARRDAQSVANAYQVATGTADSITYLDDFWNGSDADRDQLLSALSSLHPAFEGLVHLGVDWQPHGASSEPSVGPDWRSAVVEAAQAGKPTFANRPDAESEPGETVLPILVPMQEVSAPRRQGFLGINLHIERLTTTASGAPFADDSSVFLVDGSTARALALTKGSAHTDPRPTSPDLTSIMSGPRVFHVSDALGHDHLAAWESVPGTSWIVLVYVRAESLLTPIRTQAVQQALVALDITSILSLLLLAFWRRLRRRLRALELAAGNWASGNWSYRSAMAGSDELGQVASAFNSMAGQLQELFTREQEVQNELLAERVALEERVRERTAQLEQTVGDLQALAVENMTLQAALVVRGTQLQELVERLFSAQEEERRHVAIDVHDGVAQTAAATHQRLESLAAAYRPRSPQTRRDLHRARELSRRTVQEARRIIAGLRPTVLDDFGLTAALQQLAEQLRADGLEVTAEVRFEPGSARLAPVVETALYRVAQEAVANVRKHAAADRVRLTLQHAGEVLRLTIADNGRGFDPSDLAQDGPLGERVGLDGMHERLTLLGGQLTVESRPGRGTRVIAELPLASSVLSVDGRRVA